MKMPKRRTSVRSRGRRANRPRFAPAAPKPRLEWADVFFAVVRERSKSEKKMLRRFPSLCSHFLCYRSLSRSSAALFLAVSPSIVRREKPTLVCCEARQPQKAARGSESSTREEKALRDRRFYFRRLILLLSTSRSQGLCSDGQARAVRGSCKQRPWVHGSCRSAALAIEI